jgi:Peptidase family M28
MTAKQLPVPICCGGLVVCGLLNGLPAFSQVLGAPPQSQVKELVGRLDLERYKATIKGLTQFGDRQQGTDRNRAALDWIEAQLKSYGCANTERIRYVYNAPALQPRQGTGAAKAVEISSGEVVKGVGGSRLRGFVQRQLPNNDPAAQTDPSLRALNAGPVSSGPSEEVYCTKVGATHPDEMYIVGAHMDGQGLGEAADDDGSGTALVMELARVFSDPDVVTERSIRFVLWNNEESGHVGSRAYVQQRAPLQGEESPPGSRL